MPSLRRSHVVVVAVVVAPLDPGSRDRTEIEFGRRPIEEVEEEEEEEEEEER